MSFTLRITGPAQRDLRENHHWWSEHRSAEQADRWLIEIDKAIYSLREQPSRHAWATEPELRNVGLRQLPFGLGTRPSHRILYGIEKKKVIIYRVRAFKQDQIRVEDLTS